MKIQEWELAQIKPYENNPRKNDAAVDKVAASIQEFGFKVPIIVDRNGVIVAGHTRMKAAAEKAAAKTWTLSAREREIVRRLSENDRA